MPTRNIHIRFILVVKHIKKNTKLNWLHHNFLMGRLSNSGQNRNSLQNFETRNFVSELWERSASFILYITIMNKVNVFMVWLSL